MTPTVEDADETAEKRRAATAPKGPIMTDAGRVRVLIIDDDEPLCDLLRLSLNAAGFAATTRTSAEAGLAALASHEFDVLVTDMNLPEMGGLDLCRMVAVEFPSLPVVVITAYGSLDAAIDAIRAGAADFITKPVQVENLRDALARVTLQRGAREAPPLAVAAGARSGGAPSDILGQSPAVREMLQLIARAATSDASVLITGESGTGKELVAQALHRAGRRANGPFVAMNCAAVPESLLEGELFGHVRGAFTDAKVSRQGLFVNADGGTLLLDEIGDMPIRLQPKLLRALQQRTVRPLGGATEIPFDVRLIAATNDDLPAAIVERRFRNDLFFRINVIHIEVPPLRARGEDVILLAEHFVSVYASRYGKSASVLSSDTLDRLRRYAWPGNVRELQNCIERAVALSDGKEITVQDLSRSTAVVAEPQPAAAPRVPENVLVPLAEIERRHMLRVLEAVKGNKALAARVLGLDRRTLYRRLGAYNEPITPDGSGGGGDDEA